MTYEVSLSLGTNIDPEHHMIRAIQALPEDLQLKAISSVYLTEPVGMKPGADRFHNLCILLDTTLPPDELKEQLRSVEHDMGRRRSKREKGEPYEPRRIDIDILTYDPVPDGFEPSGEIVDCGYVVYPLADLMDPPSCLGVRTREVWRDRCDADRILGTVDYDWPDDLRNLTV